MNEQLTKLEAYAWTALEENWQAFIMWTNVYGKSAEQASEYLGTPLTD